VITLHHTLYIEIFLYMANYLFEGMRLETKKYLTVQPQILQISCQIFRQHNFIFV